MTPTIHFMLRIERPAPDGSVAVYTRITFDRKQIIGLATGKTIPLKKEYQNISVAEIKSMPAEERYKLYCWDKERERATKGFGSMEKFNLFLDDEKARANNILHDLYKRERLSPENFKKEFFKTTNLKFTFLEYCLNEIRENRSEQFAYDTKRSYKSVITKLDAYKPGAMLSDINYKFLVEYENYLMKPRAEGGKGNSRRTVEKNMKVIRTFICIAIKNGDFSEKDYPFKDYKIRETAKYFSTRDFLEPEEIFTLEKLYNSFVPDKSIERLSVLKWKKREENGIITPGEHRALHSFLIGVYTGLRFRDIITLNAEEHLRSKNIANPKTGERSLKHYIEIDLHKTGVKVLIPLIEKAVKLIDVNRPGKLCDTVTNQKMNRHLKSRLTFAAPTSCSGKKLNVPSLSP